MGADYTYLRLKTDIEVTNFRLNRSIDENDVLMEILEGQGYVIMQGSLFSFNNFYFFTF